ncbi:MAG: hypothetical protein JWQ72_1038 [Polaromonas sp.]|nr:hypothetical protein [Polaromonas sp.]
MLTSTGTMAVTPARVLLPLLASVLALLAGCEAMTPAECATADWRSRGLQDGMRGTEDRAAAYYESCSAAGRQIDLQLYRTGRSQGLLTYCRLDNAMSEGLAGHAYGDVCPPALDPNFRLFHEAAYAVYRTGSHINSLRSGLRY